MRFVKAGLAAILIGFFVPAAARASDIINTVAGNGGSSFSGDGGPATAAGLSNPTGVAVDVDGNLFIADQSHHRIRKVDLAGTITTVAGDGSQGFAGDGGPATAARLSFPTGVAIDPDGNLFIADLSNHRIRKVDLAGTISTVAGDGSQGFAGDGASATAARLSFPYGVTIDPDGNLFIADQGNNRIRRVGTGGIISTVAGTSQGFSGDGGPATAARLTVPTGVAVDPDGNLFVADRGNQRIRKVDIGGIISTVAGTGSQGFSGDGGLATTARLSNPYGVAVNLDGVLFIADQTNNRIRAVDPGGTISTVAGIGVPHGFSGDGGPATAAQLFNPSGVAVDPDGNLFIADQSNQRIRIVGADADGDGLVDFRERQLGTDPEDPDTDGDGLADGDEINLYHTNPLTPDTDDDGLSDGNEVDVHATNPLDPDTDDDGLDDGDEVGVHATNPLDSDTDDDGLIDGREVNETHTDPLDPDSDDDGLTDGREVGTTRTNPNLADTDGDGFGDGFEEDGGTCNGLVFNARSDPNNPLSTPLFTGTNLNPGPLPTGLPPACNNPPAG